MNKEVDEQSANYYKINYDNFVRQGWQCPVCKKILAPFMTYCPFHNEENNKWSITSATGTVEVKK